MNIFLYLNVKSILIELLIINAICSAILVIISKNPVISVIFLISLVLNSALFLMVKGMSFLGISYILIYLGAIIVLFLFVIMMINIRLTDILETGNQYTKNIPLAFAVSALFLYEFLNVLPSFFNSSILSLDNSLLVNLIKEIVLSLNTLICEGFNTKTSLLSLSNNSFASILHPHGAEQVLSEGIVEPYAIMHFPEGEMQWIKTQNNPNIFSYISNQNWPETMIGSYIQIVSVAYSLYTYGASWFLLLGLILLLAMIAPIYLSRK